MYQSSDDQCLDSFIHVFCRCCKILLILTIKRSEMHNPINYSTREREGRKGQRRREREKRRKPHTDQELIKRVFSSKDPCVLILYNVSVLQMYIFVCVIVGETCLCPMNFLSILSLYI